MLDVDYGGFGPMFWLDCWCREFCDCHKSLPWFLRIFLLRFSTVPSNHDQSLRAEWLSVLNDWTLPRLSLVPVQLMLLLLWRPVYSPVSLSYSTHTHTHTSSCIISCKHIGLLHVVSALQQPLSLPSVLWHCWLGDRKGIRPVKNWVLVGWLVGWWWWFDWSFVRLIAPVITTTSTILCFNKHQLTQVHLENSRYNAERERVAFINAFNASILLVGWHPACKHPSPAVPKDSILGDAA